MAVYERKGIWYVSYRPDGKWGRKINQKLPPAITSREDALLIEQTIRERTKAHKAGPSANDHPDLTMSVLFDRYLLYIEANRARTTYVDVEIALRHLTPVIGAVKLSQLSEGYINIYKKKRQAEGVTNRTINKELSWLSGLLTWCKNKGVVVPTIRLEKLSHTRPLPIILDPFEVQALFEVSSPFWRALFGLLYFCGMRLNEARKAKWEETDFDRHLILVPKGKGSRPRILPLPDIEIAYLSAIQTTSTGYIFESPVVPGKPVYNVKQAIKRYARLAGIKKNVYAHLLRHSVASHMLSNNINLRTIQSILGHGSTSTTEWYTHLNIDNLRTASDQVAHGWTTLSLPSGE